MGISRTILIDKVTRIIIICQVLMNDSKRRVTPSATAQAAPEMPDRSLVKPRRIASEDLFAGVRELVIVHQDKEYRLRITHKGKLILTA